MLLNIEHITLYRYSAPVQLGTHRLMLRPLEGHDVQIRSATLSIKPESRIRWLHDIFGNSIAVVDFLKPATELRFEIEFCERFLPKGMDETALRALVAERVQALGIRDPKQAGRLIGDIMKTHKGQVDAGDVKRVAEEVLKAG